MITQYFTIVLLLSPDRFDLIQFFAGVYVWLFLSPDRLDLIRLCSCLCLAFLKKRLTS